MTAYPPTSPRWIQAPGQPGRGRVVWRSAAVGAASVGVPLGTGLFHPLLAEVISGVEAVVALTVIAVALFGSQTLSERAFRLLRWFSNRPEPPA